MEQQENTFAMSQCMLTKQYGKYKAVIQFSAVDRPETEEKVLLLIMGAYAERRCASVNWCCCTGLIEKLDDLSPFWCQRQW